MLGLARLGVDVFWVDCVRPMDPRKHAHGLEYLAKRFDRMAEDFAFKGRYCIVCEKRDRYFGMTKTELRRLARDTDLVVNLGGPLPESSVLMAARRRAYVDVDPGYTQLWAQEWDLSFDRHDLLFTVGQNVGGPGFAPPTDGREWIRILPPVVLEQWPARIDSECRRFSTVLDWRGSQQAKFNGRVYGGKREEFLRYLRLPTETGQHFELALCIGQHDHADLGRLHRNGWRAWNSYLVAGDPHSYREFIQHSRCEFGVAKSGYVETRSGWISDRTACYLASGKPAIVQSTGFEERLPTGEGLLTFRTPSEAAACVREVEADYLAHARAARRLAEEHFDSDKVLGSMLDAAGLR